MENNLQKNIYFFGTENMKESFHIFWAKILFTFQDLET